MQLTEAIAPESAELYVDEERPETAHAWRPESLVDLDWCLSRLAALQQQVAENEEIAEARIAEIRARTETLNERLLKGVRFFEGQVRAYAEAHRAELLKGGKAKSRKLLGGTIGWRAKKATAKVVDEEALLEWARSQPVESSFIRIVEKPAWDAIKQHIETTGEVLPGTDLEPESETFFCKPAVEVK